MVAFSGSGDTMTYKGEVGDYYKYEGTLYDTVNEEDAIVYIDEEFTNPYYSFYVGSNLS